MSTPKRRAGTRADVVRLIAKMQDILPERFDELYEARAGRYPRGWGGTCTATVVEYYQRRVDDYIKAIIGLQRDLIDSVYDDDRSIDEVIREYDHSRSFFPVIGMRARR